jgi:1-deoxy-D-xylulose-5-phosphate reductoisomerase
MYYGMWERTLSSTNRDVGRIIRNPNNPPPLPLLPHVDLTHAHHDEGADAIPRARPQSLDLNPQILKNPNMKKVVILGSTGSLGTQTLEVLKKYPNDFRVIGLSANLNKELLEKQAQKLKIKNTVLVSRDGEQSLNKLAQLQQADIIINVLSGTSGIEPTKIALSSGKTVLLGNKESLVAEGEEIMKLAASKKLIPLDSEHNAIYEILRNYPNKKIEKIILPCSGGPFFGKTKKELSNITAKQALAHPKWKMGPKITIESAALLNKGLEIIEAHYLFDLPLTKIEAHIHPECLIHGIVEFENDPQSVAYISKPDMREHIENALLRTINIIPNREIRPIEPNEFTLLPPDHKTFPGIKIVTEAFNRDRTKMPQFLKKEERLITRFLQNKINFTEFIDLARQL